MRRVSGGGGASCHERALDAVQHGIERNRARRVLPIRLGARKHHASMRFAGHQGIRPVGRFGAKTLLDALNTPATTATMHASHRSHSIRGGTAGSANGPLARKRNPSLRSSVLYE